MTNAEAEAIAHHINAALHLMNDAAQALRLTPQQWDLHMKPASKHLQLVQTMASSTLGEN